MITFHVSTNARETRTLRWALRRSMQAGRGLLLCSWPWRREASAGPRAPYWDLQTSSMMAMAAAQKGEWKLVESELLKGGDVAMHDPACLNLLGLAAEMRGDWERAKRLYGRAMRRDRSYLPAELNMRRYFELFMFGKSTVPRCVGMVRSLPQNLKEASQSESVS